MSLIKRIDPAPKFDPTVSNPPVERLIVGNPVLSCWAQDESHEGSVKTGVWQATPGETHSIKGTSFEFCHILSGRIELIDQDGTVMKFGAGDSFVMKPGFVGIWRTIETVKKIYVVASGT